MSTVKELFNVPLTDWTSAIFILVLLIFAIPTIIEQLNKILKVLGLKTIESIEKDKAQKRIERIESDIVSVCNSMDEMNKGLATLTAMLREHIKDDNENNVAMNRSTLWRIHTESMKNGYITKEGLKTFTELGRVYERSGGDDIYHDKLYPDVMKLDVR